MIYPRLLGAVAVAFGLVAAQQSPEDPVLKAKAQRAQAGAEEDLPPVPRTVMEPPPSPPPEKHVKDTPGYRAKRGKKGKKGQAAKGGAAKKAPARHPKKGAAKKK